MSNFENITMTGRLCYIFMCMERYLVTLYPDMDWTPVAKRMWQWTTHGWNESWDIYSEAVPEYIMQFDTYEETNKLAYDGTLKRCDYDEITLLFKNMTNGSGDDEFCRILRIPIDFGNACEGAGFRDAEPEVNELIHEVETILQGHGIPLPEKESLIHFIFDREKPVALNEKNPGWGDYEATDHLSVILKQEETL